MTFFAFVTSTFFIFMLRFKVNVVTIYGSSVVYKVKHFPKSLYIRNPHGSTASQRGIGRLFEVITEVTK